MSVHEWKPLDVERLRESLAEFFTTLPASPVDFQPAQLTDAVAVEVCAHPYLAEVQALAERCKAGDLEALTAYPDEVRALLGAIEGQKGYIRAWKRIVELNESILEARC